jgi:hypothetical protein
MWSTEKSCETSQWAVRKSYEDRVAEQGLESLEKRRARLDLIEAFIILRGKNNPDPTTWFILVPHECERLTRMAADGLCLERVSARIDLRKNFFISRVVEP